MSTSLRLGLFALTTTLTACVTVNIYFPAAAAEQAADKVIEEVWGGTPEGAPAPANPGPSSGYRSPGTEILARIFSLVVSEARAQADIDVTSPGIRKLTGSMQARHGSLEPHYQSGAVGLTGDGLVTLRDPNAVPLAQRRSVSQLVADENRDRNALYQEVARANGQPGWEPQIRETFARRWVANARPGWWYQGAGGGWMRK